MEKSPDRKKKKKIRIRTSNSYSHRFFFSKSQMKIVLGSNASVASLTTFLEFCKPAQKCSMYQVIKKNITLDIII